MLWSVRVAPAGREPNLYDIMIDGSCMRWKGTWFSNTWLAISEESNEHIYGARMVV